MLGTNMNDTLGSYWEQTVTSGSSYLLRVVNAAIDTHFDFSIDNHTLQVKSSASPLRTSSDDWKESIR